MTRDQRQPPGSQSRMGRLAELTVTWAGGATTRDRRNPAGGGDGHLGERGDDEGSAAASWQSIANGSPGGDDRHLGGWGDDEGSAQPRWRR
jgi:hypothetical protein